VAYLFPDIAPTTSWLGNGSDDPSLC